MGRNKGIRTQIAIYWLFYQYFLFISSAITLFSLYTAYRAPFLELGIIGLKLLSYVLIYYVVTEYKKKEFYYFYNLGFPKLKLWLATFLFDFLIFVILFILVNTLK